MMRIQVPKMIMREMAKDNTGLFDIWKLLERPSPDQDWNSHSSSSVVEKRVGVRSKIGLKWVGIVLKRRERDTARAQGTIKRLIVLVRVNQALLTVLDEN